MYYINIYRSHLCVCLCGRCRENGWHFELVHIRAQFVCVCVRNSVFYKCHTMSSDGFWCRLPTWTWGLYQLEYSPESENAMENGAGQLVKLCWIASLRLKAVLFWTCRLFKYNLNAATHLFYINNISNAPALCRHMTKDRDPQRLILCLLFLAVYHFRWFDFSAHDHLDWSKAFTIQLSSLLSSSRYVHSFSSFSGTAVVPIDFLTRQTKVYTRYQARVDE